MIPALSDEPAAPAARLSAIDTPAFFQQSPEMFAYSEIPIDQIDLIGPLWTQLCAHHAGISTHFASHFHNRTFAARRDDFVKSHRRGKMKIDLVRVAETGRAVAYCVSTLTHEGAGEVDSLFVDSGFRGQGVGTELVRRALDWLKSEKAATIVIEVAYGNDEALPFYARFGFLPRRTILCEKKNSA
jgi:GNAT superfamily N-acetyltransferase